MNKCSNDKIKKLEATSVMLISKNNTLIQEKANWQKQYEDIQNRGPVEVPVIEFVDREVVEVIDNSAEIVALERELDHLADRHQLVLDSCNVEFWKDAYYIAKKKLEEAVKDTLLKQKFQKNFAGYDFDFDVFTTGEVKGLSFETKPSLIPSAFKCPECPTVSKQKNEAISIYYGALYKEEMNHLFELEYSNGWFTTGVGHTRPMDKSGDNGWLYKVGTRVQF